MSQALDRTRQLLADRARRTQSQHLRTILAAAKTERLLALQIIGGYTLSGIDCVRYAAGLTPSQAWDPEVHTSGYDAGLGRAWLFVDGVMQPTRVLVRHDWSAHPRPLISGQRIQTHGTVALTYDPGGGGTVVTMTAYTPSWA